MGCAAYAHFIFEYLRDVPQVKVLGAGFACSLMFGLWYELRAGDWRGSLIRMTAVSLVLTAAACLAPHARAEWFSMLAYASQEPELVHELSAEGLALASNHLVGFGGCFGLSALVVRLTCSRALVRALSLMFKHDATVRPCPHCQKAVPL